MASEGPRATVKKTPPFTVGRGPVPRHASVGRETVLVGVRFSRGSGDRGGQAPARRYAGPSPLTVGRGPVPRHASVGKTALVGVRFSRGSGDRGGQAPARRYARPSPFHRRARACPSPCHSSEAGFTRLSRFTTIIDADASNTSWQATTAPVHQSPNPVKSWKS